jgi:hypothetical protein
VETSTKGWRGIDARAEYVGRFRPSEGGRVRSRGVDLRLCRGWGYSIGVDFQASAIGERVVCVGSELTPSYGRLRICTNDSRRAEPEVGLTSRTLRDALLHAVPAADRVALGSAASALEGSNASPVCIVNSDAPGGVRNTHRSS